MRKHTTDDVLVCLARTGRLLLCIGRHVSLYLTRLSAYAGITMGTGRRAFSKRPLATQGAQLFGKPLRYLVSRWLGRYQMQVQAAILLWTCDRRSSRFNSSPLKFRRF